MDKVEPLIDYTPGSGAFLYAVFSFIAFGIARFMVYDMKFQGNFRTLRNIRFHTLEIIIEKEVIINFLAKTGAHALVTKIGKKVPAYVPCDVIQSSKTLVIDWKQFAKLTIVHTHQKHHSYEFKWVAYNNEPLEDHIQILEGGHWYGVGHTFTQPWPMERMYEYFGPFVVNETSVFKTTYGEVQERMWITSSGIALFVEFDVPLFVSINSNEDKTIKFKSCFKSPYQKPETLTQTFMSYSVVQTDQDVLEAFNALRKNKIPLPVGIPNKEIFTHPIWSTWAQYKKCITQDKVMDFANAIQKHGFKASQLEIDDDWTPHYGDWDFDGNKFPDPKEMMTQLKELGYRVTLWVHPFASFRSAAFWEGLKIDKETWVRWKICGINFPAVISWWNGYGALLDVTNKQAVARFKKKMKDLQNEYGVTSFKVDAGEAGRLSSCTKTKESLENPNTYTQLFAELTYDLDQETRAQEIRVGVGAQNLPIFFRLQDKDSNWTHFNGLKTVIPHVLTQGLIGYPFVLPDMIGGNAYSGHPEKELFIRWVELNALLPSMQFSIVPWMYDDEAIKICKKMCELHEKYSTKIIELAEESTKTGSPIIRPLWWIAPKDETALTISTEFLLGDDVLVAPVLDNKARTRNIYLPSGTWRDEIYNNQLEGGKWYMGYPAELDQLPHFTKI